jgi:histone deacetylase 11
MFPVVYHPGYAFPSKHGFDGQKYSRIVQGLTDLATIFEPNTKITPEYSHTLEYLQSLQTPETIRSILEVPEDITQDEIQVLLDAMKLQYQGSLRAAELAVKHGFAVNLGGGFHHASINEGGGFCVYNDITACVQWLLENQKAKRILIIDLDAHQGNGYEKDLVEDAHQGRVCIFDAFTPMLYPFPLGETEKDLIHYLIPYTKEDRGDEFIGNLLKGIDLPFQEFFPDFVIYNAGTDTLEGDPRTGLCQTEAAISDRDLLVVETCKRAGVPVMILLSGGYQYRCAEVITESLKRIYNESIHSPLRLSFEVPNKPPTWSCMPMWAKIRHYKTTLHPGYSRFVDKLEAKRIVKQLCGDALHVAPVRRILASPSDFQESDVSSDVLLKATHGSGWNIDLEKATDVSVIRSKLSEWNVPYRSDDEPQYSCIAPRFFIEEKIEDAVLGKTGKALVYMLRCIHGKPCTISVKQGTEQITFDTTWTPLNLMKPPSFHVEKPACLPQLLKLAEELSASFEFVRVDFYIGTEDRIYFSEYTFSPAGGNQVFPDSLEREFGALWK